MIHRLGSIIIHQLFHLRIELSHGRYITIGFPTAIRHQDGSPTPVRIIIIYRHKVRNSTWNPSITILCIKTIQYYFLEEIFHVIVINQRVEHLIRNIQPSQFFSMRTIGDTIIQLTLNGITTDDMYIIEQGVAGFESTSQIHITTQTQGSKIFWFWSLIETYNLKITETMVHKLRSPFLAIFLACKSISLIRICRACIEILHKDRSISIQTFSLTKSDHLPVLTFQFETVLTSKVSAEIHYIEMISATIYTLHIYRFPFFHHTNRFIMACLQNAEALSLTTFERRRGYHLYWAPSTYIIESLTNTSYFLTGIIVLTAPPVAS